METPDLVALVLELEATAPTYIENHMGRAMQRFGLTILDQFDPDLAQQIHDTDDMKPFTVSGLMADNGVLYERIPKGGRAWVRLTGLSALVAAALLRYHDSLTRRLTIGQPVMIELDRSPWRLVETHISGHPWAGTTSYQALIDRRTRATPPKKLALMFCSPTTFRSQTVNLPLPLPSLVFGSLLSRWIAFTSHRLRDLPEEQLDAFIHRHLLISQHNIQTDLVRGKQGSKEIGFTGRVSYNISRKSAYLSKHAPELENLLQTEHKWFARTVGMLADFALYSGIGRKTTTGLGTAREI